MQAELSMEIGGRLMSIAQMGLDRAINTACDILKRGGLVALPTDTIYGVASLAQREASVERLYTIKRRDLRKPLAICVGQIEQIYDYCIVPRNIDRRLLEALLPGKVTLCFERSAKLPSFFNPQTKTVGVRIPSSAFVRGVCERLAEPLALTSANISNERSTLRPSEFDAMWPALDAVFDGECRSDSELENDTRQLESSEYDELRRAGSTVVDLSGALHGSYRLIRAGCAFEQTCGVIEEQFGLKRSVGAL